MEAARFVGRDNNDNAALVPSLWSLGTSRVQFSHFLRSPLLFRGNRDSALRLFDRSINRSQVVDRLQTIRAYAAGIPTSVSRQKEAMVRTRGTFPPSKSSFIPAILLDNERPGYRKGRAAYGRQRRLATGALRHLSRDFCRESLSACVLRELPLIAGIAVNRQSLISACRSEQTSSASRDKIDTFLINSV